MFFLLPIDCQYSNELMRRCRTIRVKWISLTSTFIFYQVIGPLILGVTTGKGIDFYKLSAIEFDDKFDRPEDKIGVRMKVPLTRVGMVTAA